jgi:hypothetical protein
LYNNTKTSEIFQYKTIFSVPVQNIRLQNSYIYKNPLTPQGRDVRAIICRQL